MRKAGRRREGRRPRKARRREAAGDRPAAPGEEEPAPAGALDFEIRRHLLLDRIDAVTRELEAFTRGPVPAGAALRTPKARGAPEAGQGRQHGLCLRDAETFCAAAVDHGERSVWRERALQAARRQREWWFRRFRPWDLPFPLPRGRRWLDRLVLASGLLIVVSGAAWGGGWAWRLGQRPGGLRNAEPPPREARDANPGADPAAVREFARRFLAADGWEAKGRFARAPLGQGRPRLPGEAREDVAFSAHWAERLDARSATHWLEARSLPGEESWWVPVVAGEAAGPAGLAVDLAALEESDPERWETFIRGAQQGEEGVFRILARRADRLRGQASGSVLTLSLRDRADRQTIRVGVPWTSSPAAWWLAEEAAAGTGRPELRMTTLLRRGEPGPERERTPAFELVAILGKGWVLP